MRGLKIGWIVNTYNILEVRGRMLREVKVNGYRNPFCNWAEFSWLIDH